MDDFADTTSMQNPIFKIMGMGSSITEEEIQNHKNKIKNLITKLINTHNIDEETSINNDIKNETEFLSSLFKIKRNELNQNMNNNTNINLMQQPMMDQQMMQQQMMAQQQMMQNQMMQQQMMQQQMMAAQQSQAQQEMQNILNNQIYNGISVIFRQSGGSDDFPKIEPIRIDGCYPDQQVSSIIERYRIKSGDFDVDKKFIFNAKNLPPYLSFAEAGLSNNANIFVVKTKRIKENK